MTPDFTTLRHVSLNPTTTFAATTEPPEPIEVSSPAVAVMTDFKYVHPIATGPEVPIDEALETMKAAGIRLLFVTDARHDILGIITAADILGERPIKFGEASRVPRSAIVVETIMTPQPAVSVIRWRNVRAARVGHVVATMRELEKRHLLVVRVDDATGSQQVIGMFSASEIGKRLGRGLVVEVPSAHSLAELVQTID